VILLQPYSLIFAALVSFAAAAPLARGAEAYLIVDSQTGYVLDERNPRQKRQIGSLTKIATAMVVLDWAAKRGGDLNQLATIPAEAFVGTGENHIGYQPGDVITLRDLLYAALVQSDNIAACALANYVGQTLQGTIPSSAETRATPIAVFVGQMNALAKRLQMERTRFLNPFGGDEREHPYSTAADVARLTRYATSNAGFRFYVSQKTRQITFHHAGHPYSYLLKNTNELLGVNGIDGVKTGRTMRAGDCLVLSASRESQIEQVGQATRVYPRHLIIVLLGSTDRFGEGAQMLNRGWQLYDQWVAGGRMSNPKQIL
jgi:D-alanyl-D-alanine carboxypeptidase